MKVRSRHRLPIGAGRLALIAAILFAAGAALSSCGGCEIPPAAGPAWNQPHEHRDPAAPPNVVFIVLDTARADRMSHNGYSRLTTPRMDAFGRDAVIYRSAHSVSPWTLPSHMSMFTGLLPRQHGATWQAFASPDDMELSDILEQSFRFADPSRLLPSKLSELGYSTTGFSSNAWISRRTGFDQGFDSFYELWKEEELLSWIYHWLPPRLRTSKKLPSWMWPFSEMDAGDAGKVLRQFRGHVIAEGELQEPFFLFFNFIDPHFPYSPPGPWRYLFSDDEDLAEATAHFKFDELAMGAGKQPFDMARFSPLYDAEMSYLDFVVGRLLEWLKRKGYYDETLIVITSDHGEHLGEGGRFSHQFSVAEELLAVPLIIRYPGDAARGLVFDNPLVSNLDAYQTILDVASQGRSREAGSPSRSLRDMERFDRRFLIADYAYSLPFLKANQRKWAEFPLEEHRVNRHVVYDGEGRYTFVERDGQLEALEALEAHRPSEPPDPLASAARERAESVLQRHLEGDVKGMFRPAGEATDPETLDRLRALGYVE